MVIHDVIATADLNCRTSTASHLLKNQNRIFFEDFCEMSLPLILHSNREYQSRWVLPNRTGLPPENVKNCILVRRFSKLRRVLFVDFWQWKPKWMLCQTLNRWPKTKSFFNVAFHFVQQSHRHQEFFFHFSPDESWKRLFVLRNLSNNMSQSVLLEFSCSNSCFLGFLVFFFYSRNSWNSSFDVRFCFFSQQWLMCDVDLSS